MKPPPFQYHDPKTVAEAVQLLGTLDNAKLLAGGQSLMPMLNMRFVLPDHVIDLNRIEGLAYIREEGGAIEIGAMTRQRDVEFSELIREKVPLLHEAMQQIGHRQTRNRGTIGGSLCHLDPAAELVTVAAALEASVIVEGPPGRREIAFAEFPMGFMMPSIGPDEMVVAVRLPLWPAGPWRGLRGIRAAAWRFRHRVGRRAGRTGRQRRDRARIRHHRRRGGGAGARRRGRSSADPGQAPDGRSLPRSLRKLPRYRGDGGHPRLGRLPPASGRRSRAPRAVRACGLPPSRLRIDMTDTRTIAVTVNGARHEKKVPVRLTLADFLRGELG